MKKGTLEKLKKKLEEKERELGEIEGEMEDFKIDPFEYEDQFCEILDEQESIFIEGIEFTPSQILKKCDEVAFREGLLNYVDSLEKDGLKESLPEWKEMEEKKKNLENEIETLIESLKEEIGEGE